MRIAVIGHGISPAGRGWGNRIDSLPVVRMHDWHWQGKEDYGTRADYIVIPGPWGRKPFKSMQNDPPAAAAYLLYAFAKRKAYPEFFKERPVLRYRAQKLAKPVFAGGFVPTRGLCGILMAADATGAREIVLAGFDSLLEGGQTLYAPDSGVTFDAQYLGKPVCDRGRHDYALEAAFLSDWATRHSIFLIHATDLWT